MNADWDPRDHARGGDPWTSHAAAGSVRPESILAALTRVYRAAGPRGLTASEAGDAVAVGSGAGAWKRVSDLIRHGVIVDSGRTRPGPSGRAQRVLVIVPPDGIQLSLVDEVAP